MANLTLQQYIRALGESEGHFFMQVGVPGGILKTLDRDESIAEAYATKICKYLSQEFERPITIADIKDLKVC